jgi:hypothetical protein
VRPVPFLAAGLLALAAPAAGAQEPVVLRVSVRPDTVHYRYDADIWMRSPLLPSGDTSLPTVRITMHSTRTAQPGDSGTVLIAVTIDSSRLDMPAVRAVAPQFAQAGDYLRGMRTITTADSLGRALRTRVTSAPNLPLGMPVLIRGIQSLALAGLRLTTFAVPPDPVGPGDMWSDSLQFVIAADSGVAPEMVQGTGRSTASFRLDRLEDRGGSRIAVVSSTARSAAVVADPRASGTLILVGDALFDFDVARGRVLRASVNLAGPLVTRRGDIPTRMRLTFALE